MMFRGLRRVFAGQRGFTLLEVVVTLAITGIIGIGATMATVQILTQGSRNVDYTTASRHAMNAIFWISRDAQMSQTVEPSGANGYPLTLSWTEWDNSEHAVIYSIEDDRLMRSYSIDGDGPREILVALYINSTSENTSCQYSDRVLTLRVTATVGDGTQALNVGKVREITPRPGL